MEKQTLLQEKPSKLGSRKKTLDKSNTLKRRLVHKKFTNWKVLVIVFVFCLLYLFFHIDLIKNQPGYLILLIELTTIFLIWNKLYQIIYDLKLLFSFSNKYDVNISFPNEKVLPTITFIIPSYHEPFSVAKMTFDSIVDAPYNGSKEIIVVDNSKDTLTEDFMQWEAYIKNYMLLHPEKNMSTKFLYNEMKATLKPGNLDLAQQYIEEGELVVIVDVDSTLPMTENLLERAVSEFEADNELGFLQFNIKATNNHFNSLTQAVAVTQDLHRLRMTSRSYGGYKIFEGHNGMWRKDVLDQIGTWTDYYKGNIMITEDILKSAQMYAKGYYGKSLHIETGEWIPSSLKALESMWMRWTYGTSQVLLKYNRQIYCKQTTLVEKFDVSYHILNQVATGLMFPIAFLFQLFIPGMITNILIISIFILPQIIGSMTSYFTSIHKLEIPLQEKLRHVYAGFFLIDTFIMVTQIKSNINFMLGVHQGWKVTEKGVEDTMDWKGVIYNKLFHIGIVFLSIMICVISWIINYDMELYSLIYHCSLLFLNMNLIICIITFGKQGRKENNNVESAVIGLEKS